jgi:Asp-tRNA(Asn)/Glu-tRNA(Gln) amidotransferase A subunit family amidase
MDDDDIGFLPATELARRYRAKSLSPVEVAQAVLRHIGRLEPQLNAMTLTARRRAPPRRCFCAARRPAR